MRLDDDTLIRTLKQRFDAHRSRHAAVDWSDVERRLGESEAGRRALKQMEQTGGEPDVIEFDRLADRILFCDCAAESPAGRRSLCYDRDALESRKENKPAGNVVDMAASMGIELLAEDRYRSLQTLGEFDRKTSSWLSTPAPIRKLGGALFGDRRYDHVFVYHNGAGSYYAARGFRGQVWV